MHRKTYLGVEIHIGAHWYLTKKKTPQLTSYLKFVEAVAFMDNPNSAVKQSCGLRLNKKGNAFGSSVSVFCKLFLPIPLWKTEGWKFKLQFKLITWHSFV